MNEDQRKQGVSGLMRVRNDAAFIERCVESCIRAIDELVIVCNDCTDGSEKEIERMRRRYPDKIKVYPYPYHVLGSNLTREEYELAKALPDDDPHLLCNYYNFALSKATFKYAIKIDADQLYFSDELSRWCDYCRSGERNRLSAKVITGAAFQRYLSIYRMLCLKLGKRLPLMPAVLVRMFAGCYDAYALYLFERSKACLSFSGLNVWESGEDTYVTLGDTSGAVNLLPPFNGEGDHVIFEITPATCYKKFDMPYYNTARTTSYSLIEEFAHPYRIMFMGYLWTHIASMRDSIRETVGKEKLRKPEKFVKIEDLPAMSYTEIEKGADKNMFSLFQRTLFSFVYRKSMEALKKRFAHD